MTENNHISLAEDYIYTTPEASKTHSLVAIAKSLVSIAESLSIIAEAFKKDK
jgi:hypothetical protein